MDNLNEAFFNSVEKKMPDGFKLVFNPEYFVLGVQLGVSGEALTLTPAHTKRLAAHMLHVIANYEMAHGKIAGGEYSPGTPSPIQIDFGGQGKGDSQQKKK